MKKLFHNKQKTYRIISSAAVLFVAFVFVGRVLAASSVVYEAEAGTPSGQARSVGDSSASAGTALTFITQSTGGTFTPPNPGSWTNVTSNLAGMPTICGELFDISVMPDKSTVIAGVDDHGLWKSTNNGGSWTHMGDGAGSANITFGLQNIVYDPVTPTTFWAVGIYGSGGGVYKTTNNGSTFQQLGTVAHNDWLSVDFTDPNRQTLLAGSHETANKLWKSTNGGQTWTDIGSSIPGGTNHSATPIVINANTYVLFTHGWGGGTSATWRSTNGGQSWSVVNSGEPVAQAKPSIGPSGTIYMPLWGNKYIRSSNGGATWTEVAADTANKAPIELSDGRLVAQQGNRMMISSNSGASWTQFGATLPYTNNWGFAVAEATSSVYIWYFNCSNTVPSNAAMRLM